jgi:hypothetical protein
LGISLERDWGKRKERSAQSRYRYGNQSSFRSVIDPPAHEAALNGNAIQIGQPDDAYLRAWREKRSVVV